MNNTTKIVYKFREHVDQGGLQDPQAQHEHFLLVAAVAGNLPALAVRNDGVGAVGGLHHVEAFLDLALQVPQAQVAGAEDGLLARPTSSIAA